MNQHRDATTSAACCLPEWTRSWTSWAVSSALSGMVPDRLKCKLWTKKLKPGVGRGAVSRLHMPLCGARQSSANRPMCRTGLSTTQAPPDPRSHASEHHAQSWAACTNVLLKMYIFYSKMDVNVKESSMFFVAQHHCLSSIDSEFTCELHAGSAAPRALPSRDGGFAVGCSLKLTASPATRALQRRLSAWTSLLHLVAPSR